jgi:hypothetical protein
MTGVKIFQLGLSRVFWLALFLGLVLMPWPVLAGNTTGTTRTQTYQPGEPFTGLPGGAPGRGTGLGPFGLPSVYCQTWPGHSPYPQYPGTGPNTPCGPAFQRAPVQPYPQPPPRQTTACQLGANGSLEPLDDPTRGLLHYASADHDAGSDRAAELFAQAGQGGPPCVVFRYFYVNGINTPASGHPRSQPSDSGGTYDYEYGLVSRLVATSDRVVAEERDVMGPKTHNYSGTDKWFPRIASLCDQASASGRANANPLISLACWIDQVRNGSGVAPGDLLECIGQSLRVPWLGADASSDQDEVRTIVEIMKQTIRAEQTGGNVMTYFIVVAHSQGNFFGEGVGYRLFKKEGDLGRWILNNRLGIISLGSPTSYDSLPPDFVSTRLRHETREDDAIHILDSLSLNGLLSKRPFPRSQDTQSLWPWKSGILKRIFDGEFQGTTSISNRLSGVQAVWWFMNLTAPNQTELPPLITPLMNAHLMDNYVNYPTATPGVLPQWQRILPTEIRGYLVGDPVSSPAGMPILQTIQQDLRSLKLALLGMSVAR